MSIIARLGVVLGLNSAEFTKGLDEATKKTKEFERNSKQTLKNANDATSSMIRGFGVAAAGIGVLVAAYAKLAQAADEVADSAAAFDTTIEKLLATKAALQAAGGEANNYSTMMQKLASNQDGAREGSDSLRESFNRLNISGRDVDKLKLDDLFSRVATELAKVEDATKRNAIAQDLLGKAAKGINWSDYISSYKQVADPALARAIEENAKAWGNIEKIFKDVGNSLQLMIEPFSKLLNYVESIRDVWKDLKLGADIDIDYGAAFGGMPGQEGATVFHAGKGKPKSGPIAPGARPGGYAKPSDKETEAAKKAKQEREKAIADMIALSQKFDAEMKKFEGTLSSVEKTHNRYLLNMDQETKLNVEILELERKRFYLTEEEYVSAKLGLNQKIRSLENEKKAVDSLIDARIELERASADEYWYAKQIYDEKVKNIEDAMLRQIDANNTLNIAEQKNLDDSLNRQYDFIEGFKKAYRTAAEENKKVFSLGEEAFSSVMGNMDAALATFVQTGKIRFKDFAKSIISDLLMIAMRAQVISFFSSLFMMKNPTVNVGAPSKDLGAAWVGQGLPAAASGGAIGGPTLVGENGPEIFMPNSPGTIIPNGSWQQMASRGSGMTVNGPYIANLSTIDSKSFEDRIYQSNKAIWAAGKYAEKSLAVSGGRS